MICKVLRNTKLIIGGRKYEYNKGDIVDVPLSYDKLSMAPYNNTFKAYEYQHKLLSEHNDILHMSDAELFDYVKNTDTKDLLYVMFRMLIKLCNAIL